MNDEELAAVVAALQAWLLEAQGKTEPAQGWKRAMRSEAVVAFDRTATRA